MIDWKRINDLKEDIGYDDLMEVVVLFCNELEESISMLGRDGDLARQLHFLKGSALNVGITSVSDMCQRAEVLLENDPNYQPDILALSDAFENARRTLMVRLECS